jgi:hypothetical protein
MPCKAGMCGCLITCGIMQGVQSMHISMKSFVKYQMEDQWMPLWCA